MNNAPADKTGMALGAWGAVQATAAGLGIAISGTLRDVVNAISNGNPANGYYAVYAIELCLLVLAIIVIKPLLKRSSPPDHHKIPVVR
jgi:BCD family chlorophyll transporter-like MFS transporter